jgi:colanic acid/amylovoran biosynthesis glycosyltransferase
MMRIAYFTNRYPHASHSAIRREIVALEKLGVQIDRVSIRPAGDIVDPADRAEIEKTFVVFDHLLQAVLVGLYWAIRHPVGTFRALRAALTLAYKQHAFVKNLLYFAEALALAYWLTARGIAHVHGHFGTNPAAVLMFCRLAGGPGYSFTVHGPDEFDSPRALLLRDKIHHASFVVAICEFTRSQLFRWAAVEDWNKIQIIHCGVDDSFLGVTPTPVPEAPKFVSIGRLSEMKGQLTLVRAVAALVKQGFDLHLTLIGDGPMRPYLETLIAQEGIQANIELAGWQPNLKVRQALIDSRALVLPSFAEGLPGVIMESFAVARPAISTYIAGIPEIIHHNVSGWLVPAGSVEALVEAMRSVLTAPTQTLTQMGLAGREWVLKQHNVAIEAEKFAEKFAQALAEDEPKRELSHSSNPDRFQPNEVLAQSAK